MTDKPNTHDFDRRSFLRNAGIGAIATATAGAASAKEAPKRSIQLLVHFADTDYSESVAKNARNFEGLNAHLLTRSYAYLDRDKVLPTIFSQVHGAETAQACFSQAVTVATPCEHSAMSARLAGAVVVFLETASTSQVARDRMREIGLPIVLVEDRASLVRELS